MIIAVALLCAVAGENMFLLGPPGTAKSMLASRLKMVFKDGKSFDYLMSRFSTPDEIFEFADRFRSKNTKTPLVVVPTSYSCVYEDQLKAHGINIVIYANHLLRAAFPAMKKVACSILENERCYESGQDCMSIKEILSLIPMK